MPIMSVPVIDPNGVAEEIPLPEGPAPVVPTFDPGG